MTVIERCSLCPRSHRLVDSVSGQLWQAITVPVSGIYSPGRTSRRRGPDRRGSRFRCPRSTEWWWRKRRVCGLFDDGRAAASDSTGGYQCSPRTAGMTSRHPVITAGHWQRHEVSTGVDSAQLGCPCYASFVPLSIHSRDGHGMLAAQHPSHAWCLGSSILRCLGLGLMCCIPSPTWSPWT
jgi:hypothetical protein